MYLPSKCSRCGQMTNFACMTLGQRKPLANQGLQFEKLLLSLFLMPLLILVCIDPISWQASSSSPTNPSSGPSLPSAVVLLSSSVAPLPLSAYVSAHRNHWPRSGSPLTIQHVGKLFQGEQQLFKSLGQRVKADAPWESTERTFKFSDEGKTSSPLRVFLWRLQEWDCWIGGVEEKEKKPPWKKSQLERCNFNLVHYHSDGRYCYEMEDAGRRQEKYT